MPLLACFIIFFARHGLGERSVHLHADNCGGQNKNATMVQYLLYRAMTGKHEEIILSFMITGHTKFSPDWCFSLWKKKYRHTNIGGLYDLVEVVNKSAVVNMAQLNATDGEVLVPTYDWQAFFSAAFQKLEGIKKLHHLRFTSDSPGCVYVREKSDSSEVKLCLLKHPDQIPCFRELPPLLSPAGLPMQRHWYLYNKIREFCPERTRDVTCPRPVTPLEEQPTHSRSPSPIPVTSSTREEPPSKIVWLVSSTWAQRSDLYRKKCLKLQS